MHFFKQKKCIKSVRNLGLTPLRFLYSTHGFMFYFQLMYCNNFKFFFDCQVTNREVNLGVLTNDK